MENLLRTKGYKITKARLAILDIFFKKKGPVDAQIVYKMLRKSVHCKKINEATVYRTLASFEETGVLTKVDLRKDSVYFELAGEHHHHIVCTNCDKVEEFENSEIEKLIRRIVEKSSKFIKIKEHSLELFGLCRMCV